jgi:hypothetical protein
MRQLTSLHISGLDFTQADMTLMAQLRRLDSLTLRDCSIDDYGLGVIAAHLTGEGVQIFVVQHKYIMHSLQLLRQCRAACMQCALALRQIH